VNFIGETKVKGKYFCSVIEIQASILYFYVDLY
jgi:hypothetical protein